MNSTVYYRKLTCNGLPSKPLFLDKCPPPVRPKRVGGLVIPKEELSPSAPTIYVSKTFIQAFRDVTLPLSPGEGVIG